MCFVLSALMVAVGYNTAKFLGNDFAICVPLVLLPLFLLCNNIGKLK